MATSSGLILQICLIMALSFRCKSCRFVSVNGQVSLAWSMALRMQELYAWSRVLYERWQDVRTGSSSLNFFHEVFTQVVTASSQPPPAESMSPRKQNEATTSSLSGPDLNFTLRSVVNRTGSSSAPCTPIIRI